jgi:hypothetical protein
LKLSVLILYIHPLRFLWLSLKGNRRISYCHVFLSQHFKIVLREVLICDLFWWFMPDITWENDFHLVIFIW